MIDLVINFDSQTEKANLYLTLKELKGEQVIKIKKRSKGRSVQENRYYWGVVVTAISEYTGHSKIYIHEFLKDEFIPLVKFVDDYKLTTSDMNHDQIWDYINEVRTWAKMFLGLHIADPDGVIL